MSQHLINDFIHRTYLFKPFDKKLITGKTVKYQKSNRHNHSSPEDIEESIHNLKPIKSVRNDESQKGKSKTVQQEKNVDITI